MSHSVSPIARIEAPEGVHVGARLRFPVWIHRGRKKPRRGWLRREHVCTKRCLRSQRMLGRMFYWCARYSYRKASE